MKFLLTCLGFSLLSNSGFSAHRPNIILIMADDVSWECFSCYGGDDYKTPHLDALAAKGIRFNHCYSTPICTTSRVKLMTGKYNFRNYTHFGYLNPKEKTFAHLLKSAGYKTAIAGKWQLNGLYHKALGNQDAARPVKAGAFPGVANPRFACLANGCFAAAELDLEIEAAQLVIAKQPKVAQLFLRHDNAPGHGSARRVGAGG